MSYEVMVPRRIDLVATTHNGGIAVEQVEGRMDFEAENGGISLREAAGSINARTRNGGVSALLSGTSWRGERLDLRTTNGGVWLDIPRGYNAELETGTVNGGMHVDFPITIQGRIGRRITTTLGNDGPLVRAVTTNGAVRIRERQTAASKRGTALAWSRRFVGMSLSDGSDLQTLHRAQSP